MQNRIQLQRMFLMQFIYIIILFSMRMDN
jgi:hypothetical protein